MKKVIILFACLIIYSITYAHNPIGIQSDLLNVSKTVPNNGPVDRNTGLSSLVSNSQNNTGITTFNSSSIKGTRYLFDDWHTGSVTDENNNTVSTNYAFNFDKINHDLYAKYLTQVNMSVLIDKSKIKRFTIGDYSFINSTLINPDQKGWFYQVLVEDGSKLSLYKLVKTSFVRANPADMSNVKNGNFSSEYVDNISYYIADGKEFNKVNLTANNIRKVLKAHSEKVNKYYSDNRAKDVNEDFLTDLIRFLNL